MPVPNKTQNKVAFSTAIKKFCARVSGADPSILDACETGGDESEYSKYAALGVFMLFLSCLAGITGGYAFYAVTGNLNLSIVAGIFWGAMVLALDRLIVATWSLSKSFLVNAALIGLRFALSLAVGFLISYPAEMAIFRPEIDSVLSRERTEAALKGNALLENDPDLKAQQKNLETQKQILNMEIETRRNSVQSLYNEFKDEADGHAGTMHLGYGPVSRQKEARYQECKGQFVALEKRDLAKITELDTQLGDLNTTKQNHLKDMNASQEQANGLLARAMALHRLMEERPVVFWIKWAITFVLLLLESLPILTKLAASLSGKSSYDAKQDQYKARVIAQEQKSRRITEDRAQLQDQQHKATAARKSEESKMETEKKIQENQSVLETERLAAERKVALYNQVHQATLETARLEANKALSVTEHDLETELQKKGILRQAQLHKVQREQAIAEQHREMLQNEVFAYVMPKFLAEQKRLCDIAFQGWAIEMEAEVRANPGRFIDVG